MPRTLVALHCALLACCAMPPPNEPAPSPTTDPDARFLGTEPCPDPSAGLLIEESDDFRAGDDPAPLVVLMGGGVEVDDAAVRFGQAASGGDVLVLRATGSTSSYTTWFAEELALAPAPSAVGTVLIEDPDAGDDDAVLCRVARADALWLAGGDQGDYLVRWPAALHEAMARAVARGVAVGGTSAGAMSLSALTFDASLGSVDSTEALGDPLAEALSLSRSPFAVHALDDWLVDTHFGERERLGRLVAFLARAAHDGTPVLGLGIDEETAVVIEGESVDVSGAGDAWLVALDDAPALDRDTPLDARAHVAPLSRQAGWPPTTGAAAPDASALVVVDGVLQ